VAPFQCVSQLPLAPPVMQGLSLTADELRSATTVGTPPHFSNSTASPPLSYSVSLVVFSPCPAPSSRPSCARTAQISVPSPPVSRCWSCHRMHRGRSNHAVLTRARPTAGMAWQGQSGHGVEAVGRFWPTTVHFFIPVPNSFFELKIPEIRL
jgi:hypothetical protein